MYADAKQQTGKTAVEYNIWKRRRSDGCVQDY